MKIISDRNQKQGKHELKEKMLADMGHELVSLALPVGDYTELTPEIEEVIKRRGSKLSKMDLIGLMKVSVDTKADNEELYSCLVSDHQRFSDSQFLAHNNGIKLFILVENNDGISDVKHFENWKNEKRWQFFFKRRKYAVAHNLPIPRQPVSSLTLKKMMSTEHTKYGTEFLFCKPEETAQKIVEILEQYRQ